MSLHSKSTVKVRFIINTDIPLSYGNAENSILKSLTLEAIVKADFLKYMIPFQYLLSQI